MMEVAVWLVVIAIVANVGALAWNLYLGSRCRG
jgi:hypothetical protein